MPDESTTRNVRPATAAETSDPRAMHAANRAAWDEAAERYEGWFDEALELIRAGRSNLFPVEHELIGDLRARPGALGTGKRRAIHLQCAGGRDTLSLWNLGADEVVGIDISPRMIVLAARLAEAAGAPGIWIESDVLDAPRDLDGSADLVYTGRGSIIWLHDLDGWAAVIRRLLAPDGRLVIFDGHPAEWLFDADPEGHLVATAYDYFGGVEASKGWAPEYIDRLSVAEDHQSWKFARAWTLGEIVTALIGAGLRIERLVEYPVDWWAGHRDLRPEDRGRIPLSFGIVASRGD
ncbi:MAG: class I SAM-dependent methyltransferase [Chloroflexi bacterium]|nr:class I SAM-dependent methyltransferase [Chloroflexota bacterium]